MYDELIIEEIRRKNKIKEAEDRRPMLEISIEEFPQKNSKPGSDDCNQTVITIDLNIEDD